MKIIHFFEILKLSDCLIRNTTTDGDSISIKEAIYLNKKVIATNCVDRPEGIKLIDVNNYDQIEKEILRCYSNQKKKILIYKKWRRSTH